MATNFSMKALLAMAVFALSTSLAVAEPVSPEQLMSNTTDKVMDVIKNDRDILSGNLNKLIGVVKEIVMPHIDLDRMSHNMLGQYWEKASSIQREAFKTEFATFISKIYAARMPVYDNQIVKFESPQANANSTDTILTMLISQSGTLQSGNFPEKVRFSLGKVGDEWKIYDINAEGVSLATMYRGQFLPLAKQSGMDALIQKLNEKNKQTPA